MAWDYKTKLVEGISMRKSAMYDTENKDLSIRPEIINGKLSHVTIFTSTSKVSIDNEDLDEMQKILEAIVDRYIRKMA